MSNGWPHTADGQGSTSASREDVPFGPEASWPSGFAASPGFAAPPVYSDAEYRGSGGYYQAPPTGPIPAASQDSHPYAALSAAGYGDDGYSDPGYQGPAAQDAGIRGTRGPGAVHPGQTAAGYPHSEGAGYASSGYLQAPAPADAGHGYGPVGYAGSSYAAAGDLEVVYPPGQPGLDPHQPWDYDRPLQYDGEEDRYNGSEYSMPGVDGPGYDLSGIIATSDFEAFGQDEPSYGRLSYDDPRYTDARPGAPGYPGGPAVDHTRFDLPPFAETRLDNLWQPGADVRRESATGGFGTGGVRSDIPAAFGAGAGRSQRDARTRHDLQVLSDSTRFDVPAYDETRLDNLRAFTPGDGLQLAGTAVLAPPSPRAWAEDTSLDHFEGLDLTDEPGPGSLSTLERPRPDSDTAARRAVGKRRGRSGDRRQWMALGAIAVVAAGAIGGVLMKYVFSGPGGPAHQVAVPQTVDNYTRSANLEKQMQVGTEAAKVTRASGGQASDVVSAVYEQGSMSGAAGGSAQIFMFVGGKLASADPGASVTNFEQTYAGAKAVPAGSLGGQAACTETHLNGQSASMCVWFDNDTFGTVVSPTMTTGKLAATMDQVRPTLERLG